MVLLKGASDDPSADEVAAILQAHLNQINLLVEVVEVEEDPETFEDWRRTARGYAKKRAGVVAVVDWTCEDENNCELYLYETDGEGAFIIPTRLLQADRESEGDVSSGKSRAFAVAASLREAIWGDLLPEMERVSKEGESPTTPVLSSERIPAPHGGGDDGASLIARRPVFWFEGGYAGEFPYPSSGPINGARFGAALYVSKHIVPVLSIGWLGVRTEENEYGEALSHRWPATFELRIAFPVGPALFAVAPVGRLDFVYASLDSSDLGVDKTKFGLEAHAGGMTTWNLPLPGGRVEMQAGVGILASIVSYDYISAGRPTIPPSTFRVVWNFGITWSARPRE